MNSIPRGLGAEHHEKEMTAYATAAARVIFTTTLGSLFNGMVHILGASFFRLKSRRITEEKRAASSRVSSTFACGATKGRAMKSECKTPPPTSRQAKRVSTKSTG